LPPALSIIPVRADLPGLGGRRRQSRAERQREYLALSTRQALLRR
jgi:hypothetical protein